MITLYLPYPLSANKYWQSHVRPGCSYASVHPSNEARAYKRDVGWLAKKAGCRTPSDKLIEINSMLLIPKYPKLVLDLDNCIKVTLDALRDIVYIDDSQIKRIRNVEYGEYDGKGGLIVKICDFVPNDPPLFKKAA